MLMMNGGSFFSEVLPSLKGIGCTHYLYKNIKAGRPQIFHLVGVACFNRAITLIVVNCLHCRYKMIAQKTFESKTTL